MSGSATHSTGLRHVCDRQPGIRRIARGRHFTYRSPEGGTVRDPEVLARIRSLAIPPAWTDVWICRDSRGHLQATGRDAKGRKQYRYHPKWTEIRSATKFERLVEFGEALPALRNQLDEDLRRTGLPLEKVVATVVRLLERTLIRVGNEEYARANDSFGLTTLRDHHVDVNGTKIEFHFRGKSGKALEMSWRDRRLARIVRRCQDLPGQELFQYFDEAGEIRVLASNDVNEYLRAAMNDSFTAKDFRTWAGTVAAIKALRRLHEERPDRIKGNVVETIKEVSTRLANTPAVCRRYYIHPIVLEAYEAGELLQELPHPDSIDDDCLAGLSRDEAVMQTFLRKQRNAPVK